MSTIKANRFENTASTDGGIDIDSSGSVGLGLTNPSDYHANANSLVVSSGITLANTTQGSIYFADSATGTGEYVGQLNYEHSSDSMQFVVGNSERAKLDSSGFDITGSVTAANTSKAWINFNGTGTVAIRDSFNVASITDNGTGDYTISFTNAMPNNNFCVVASSGSTAGITLYNSSPQTGSVRIDSVNYTGSNEDNAQQHVAVFAD